MYSSGGECKINCHLKGHYTKLAAALSAIPKKPSTSDQQPICQRNRKNLLHIVNLIRLI